jgi:hypothetical protein
MNTASPAGLHHLFFGTGDGRARLPRDLKLFTERIRFLSLIVSNADARAEPVPARATVTGSDSARAFGGSALNTPRPRAIGAGDIGALWAGSAHASALPAE